MVKVRHAHFAASSLWLSQSHLERSDEFHLSQESVGHWSPIKPHKAAISFGHDEVLFHQSEEFLELASTPASVGGTGATGTGASSIARVGRRFSPGNEGRGSIDLGTWLVGEYSF
eukprot:Protomagalhaensia_wolfi_Nauph_80__4481@NODE_4598_length_541_cov_3_553785_g3689_i0_p1_GENE_NODE_4598_length_541_cov_3_553785_g3689_i0NODE_4598_length_541_cov_3_553785_g3689_i0_p1_ORF_typecomplete_len115_score8_10Say1_Mug180/PF10340_9/0_12_NODE_4598_length_541_cov_3_553785_g3689_i093437